MGTSGRIVAAVKPLSRARAYRKGLRVEPGWRTMRTPSICPVVLLVKEVLAPHVCQNRSVSGIDKESRPVVDAVSLRARDVAVNRLPEGHLCVQIDRRAYRGALSPLLLADLPLDKPHEMGRREGIDRPDVADSAFRRFKCMLQRRRRHRHVQTVGQRKDAATFVVRPRWGGLSWVNGALPRGRGSPGDSRSPAVSRKTPARRS